MIRPEDIIEESQPREERILQRIEDRLRGARQSGENRRIVTIPKRATMVDMTAVMATLGEWGWAHHTGGSMQPWESVRVKQPSATFDFWRLVFKLTEP